MASEPSWRDKPRPVNLNVLQFRFPVTAIVSILHRLSGVLLFILAPFCVWAFSLSLASPDDFASVQHFLTLPLSRMLIWIGLSGLLYHFFAGIRHLMMDLGVGESLAAGRASAWLVMALALVSVVLLGVWLW